MEDPTLELFEAYAERGAPLGADAVLARARALPAESLRLHPGVINSGTRPRHSRRALAAVVLLALFVVGAGIAAGVHQVNRDNETNVESGAVPPAAAPPTASIPTPEEIAAANRREAELAASGWVAWSIEPVVPVTKALPQVGYLHTGPGVSPPLGSPTPTVAPSPDGLPRSAMYDKPDGTLLGYYYVGLGFVPVETADAPGFDAGPLYTQRGICVPGRAQECEDAKRAPPSTTK